MTYLRSIGLTFVNIIYFLIKLIFKSYNFNKHDRMN